MSRAVLNLNQARTVRGKIYRMLGVLFGLIVISTAAYTTLSQRTLVEDLVQRQTTDLAQSYFDNINTLMLTGGMANRDIPREKLLSRPEVLDARILRAEAVSRLFGPGSDYAKAIDELDRRGLAGETLRMIRETDRGRVMTVIEPLPASNDFRGTDCISCHVAAKGEILGAVRVDYSLEALDAKVSTDLLANVGINSTLMVIGLLIIGALFSKMVSRPLNDLSEGMRCVAEGNADSTQRLAVDSNDEIGELAGHFNEVVRKFGELIEETRKQSNEATRIKVALDCVTTNVMVADRDNKIIYMNPAVIQMFHGASKELQEHLPGFEPSNLLGKSMDTFHAEPKHQQQLLQHLTSTHESRVEVGERTFRIIANPVVNEQGERLGTAVEWVDLTEELKAADADALKLAEERRDAQENLRIRTALENVSSPVMVADDNYNIIYLNKQLQKMFVEAEPELRKVLPNFDAGKLRGANMDVFHKDPSHQRRLLDHMRTAVSNQIEVGGLTLKVIANPILDDEGKRVGTVVEWENRTDEVAVEKEIDNIVTAARQGQLGERIPMNGKDGFFLQLATGINDLVDVVDNVFNDIADAMQRMASGDLTQPIKNDYQGNFGKVKSDVNSTIENIEQVVGKLRESIDSITTGTSEISSGNTNLSSRTEQQASALQETAASMEQLTSTVRNNASNAQQADQLASSASALAQQGGEVVGRAVKAMGQINASSNQIAEIISVIDEIAFQTNLLALNASVEAARAGEQGRGFAVVATEVRNLASRAATSAKEIKELIQTSVTQVQVGTKLVDESGDTLQEIVGSVKKVNDIIAEIAAASAEQSAGIDQINRAVTAMDESTQQNAALAEQTSAASASVTNKARDLSHLVGFFKVKGAASPARAERAHAAAAGPLVSSSSRIKPQPTPAPAPVAAPAETGTAEGVARSKPTPPPSFDEDEWEEF